MNVFRRASKSRRPPWIPWWRLAAAVSLSAALALAVVSDRIILAAIIGVILLPSLALIALWLVGWKRGLLDENE